jgi:hypothetical protein
MSDADEEEYVDAVLLPRGIHRANDSHVALTWSRDMAYLAQEIAETCSFGPFCEEICG